MAVNKMAVSAGAAIGAALGTAAGVALANKKTRRVLGDRMGELKDAALDTFEDMRKEANTPRKKLTKRRSIH